jgi:DAACS family dicarboxylate/amino acid:cation (Na+ or H+) symporter
MSSLVESRRGMPLHTKILLGLALGAIAGVIANLTAADAAWLDWLVDNVAAPVGQVFLRMLFMVVVPLIFTSLALGVASLGDLKRVGRIGAKTIGFFLLTTAFAAAIGLTMVNLVRPGDTLEPATRDQLMAEYSTEAAGRAALAEEGGFGISTFVNIIPRNPIEAMAEGQMLSVIFFTLVFGVALTQIPPSRAAPVLRVLEGISEAVMVIIGFAMRLAPYGVAGLIFAVTAKFGLEVLKSLALYVVMVLGGLLIHQLVVIPALAKALAGVGPVSFFRKARALMVTAFSTSSSNATLPTTIRTAQENFGVPPAIAGFVLPLGATMNMNGTALFEGMTVLFLAQVFGVDLSLGQQMLVIGMSVITAVGAAGVPGGSIPLLVLVLEMVGVPGMAIALILGVDRILDMSRTVPNVTGDLLTSLVVTRSEGLPFIIPEVPLSASGEPVPAAGEGAVA